MLAASLDIEAYNDTGVTDNFDAYGASVAAHDDVRLVNASCLKVPVI